MYDSTQPPASQSGHRAIAVVGVELTLNMQYQHQKDQIILATGRGHFGRFLGVSDFSKGSPL